MKFYLYAGETIVGWSDLPHADPGMGVVSGPFYPNGEYKQIQPVIRERHLYDGSLGDIDETKLEMVQKKINALKLKVISEEDEVLKPDGGVDLIDFSEEMAEEPYHIDVLGLPREQFLKYWREDHEEYHLRQSP